LSDSDLSVGANHTFRFTSPNGVLSGGTIVLSIPSFNVPIGFDFGDIDVTDDGAPITLAAAASGDTWGVATTATSITFTTSTSSGPTAVASSSALVITMGTNATVGGAGNTQITNPGTAGSYELTVTSGQDSGQTRIAIIDDVLVTANVNTVFTFTIEGVATSSSVNGAATTTVASSTATLIPFGTLAAASSSVMAQDFRVTTNAANGFVVTVHQSQNLLSSTGADIDGFTNGNYQNTPIAWAHPTASIGNENTWGHWGLTSEDDLNSNEFGSDLWVAASTTPRQVFHHASSSDGTTANIGYTRVGYQAEITSLQEAGDDYNTTLTYVATPTF